MSWEFWWPVATSGVFAAVVTYVGYIVKEATASAIKHTFENQVEKLRSEIRSHEQKINALRAGALATLSARHETIDRRRIQAIEKLWEATISERRYRFLISAMQVIKISALIHASPHDREKLKLLGDMLFTSAGMDPNKFGETQRPSPDTERLFLPASAWDAFSALRAINAHAVAYAAAIKTGAPIDIVKGAAETSKAILLVLPHQKPFLDQYPDNGIFFLTDELENIIFKELAKSLSMPLSDQELVARASTIIEAAEGMAAKNKFDVPKDLRADSEAASAMAHSLRK